MIGVVVAVYLLAILMFGGLVGGRAPGAARSIWNLDLFLWTAALTSGVILLGSLYKTASLRGGGGVVARSLGGRQVDPATSDFAERRLLNVVEEIAIASGVPVPDVYVLDREQGLNAFAAGLTASDATVAVTRGLLDVLSRSELQGVVAHEFSHIFHGDMRLNMRAIGLLHGVFVISLIGRILMRVRRSGRKNGGSNLALLGLGLFVVGMVGVFFGRLIQSAISRQREVLADASAVQYTRNPAGLAGALKKIGGWASGSKLDVPDADGVSHMFFADGLKRFVSFGWFQTHPPLRERVRRLEPRWDGTFDPVALPNLGTGLRSSIPPDIAGVAAAPVVPQVANVSEASAARGVQAAVAHIGTPSTDQVTLAAQMRDSISPAWTEALQRPADAQAAVFALLLAQDENLRQEEIQKLHQMTDAMTVRTTCQLHGEVHRCPSRQKIALIDLALPALRRMSKAEFDRFREITDALVASDQRVDLFEFMLQRIVERHLLRYFENADIAPVKHHRLRTLVPHATVLISTLARVGNRTEREAARAFVAGAQVLGLPADQDAIAPVEKCTLAAVDVALKRYDEASPPLKKALMMASSATVMADGLVTDEEAELIRAIGDAIDCPVPPFVTGQ